MVLRFGWYARRRILCISVMLVTLVPCTWAEQPNTEIQYWHRNYDSDSSYSMLKLALDKTKDLFGSANIVRSAEIAQGRAALLLQNSVDDQLDVVEFVPEENRIKQLRPIYLALEEGLVGYRVCLIRQGEHERFKGIKSIKDFNDRGLSIGQGKDWPDTQILKENGLKVVASHDYESLYRMLNRKRFDCFLRGVHEAIRDLQAHSDLGLTIEPSLVFFYPSVSLFFVSPDNEELAMRIELGLRRALADMSFESEFNRLFANDLDKLDLSSRRIVYLNNPILSDEVLSKSARRHLEIDGKIAN